THAESAVYCAEPECAWGTASVRAFGSEFTTVASPICSTKSDSEWPVRVYFHCVKITIALITLNEEANLLRTLESVMPLVRDGRGEIVVVDSGSTDRTVEIAQSFGAQVCPEPWKGFAAQKNWAMEKGSGEWVLQLDADEALE